MSTSAMRSGVARGDESNIPDTPIDVSVPYRSRERGAARHFGFLPFFAKKPWPVVQEYIKHYSNPGDLVCDPFAGSGVTLVEALILGRRAVGTDINPVARFIARMTAIAPVDLDRLRTSYEQVRRTAQRSVEALTEMREQEVWDLLGRLDCPRTPIPPTVRRAGALTVDELHTPRQLAGLALLRDAIRSVDDSVCRDLLRVALANTVRYANRMYILPSDKGKRRSPYRGAVGFLRRFSYSPASDKLFYEHRVWPTFERVFKGVVEAKEETNRLIGERWNDEDFILADVPASRIHEVTGERAVDHCFADPPYSNDIYFLDLSTLWAAWLDLPITDEARAAELLIGGTQAKRREQFVGEFTASVESIARALKEDRWFTLVYKHRDLSLWQTIVAACEDNGLRYVNAVWQTVKIRSTRQIESHNINPEGDMYLNFRRMSQRRFEAIYGQAPVVPLPTRTNYVEHEVERLIVAYLGADVELITAGVIQQVLDSRAFSVHRDHPEEIREEIHKDLKKVLKDPRFTAWQPRSGRALWVMSPGTSVDQSLEPLDQARYYAFELLREQGEATEGEIVQHLLTRFAQQPALKQIPPDIVRSLLRSVAYEITPHRWRFDPQKVADYKQLRLLFRPSQADLIRQRIESRHGQGDGAIPRPDLEGIALLRDRLREANAGNPHFEVQYVRLIEVLQTVLWRLESDFGDQIERVLAVGDWARYGIDLRGLPADEVALGIVLRSSERPFSVYLQLAEEVFRDLRDEDIFIQFTLQTLPEWQHAESIARAQDRLESLGIPLLVRA